METTNKRDPICGMAGAIERHGHWFCSEHCIRKFERSRAASRQVVERLRDPWVWAPVSALALLAIAWVWPGAKPVGAIYAGYVQKVLLPFLLGLLLGGVIDYFVPREYIVKWLAGPRKRVIVRSTLLGFFASTCSHGCLALSIELYRKGASAAAAASFLLASPWASMSLTFILLSLFGLKALAFIGGALGIACVSGLILQRLEHRGLLETNPHTVTLEPGFSVWVDLSVRWRQYPWSVRQVVNDLRGALRGSLTLGRMVLGWVQLGLLLSALLGGLVPQGVFERFFGPSIGGLLLTLLGAAVIEVCSEGTAPLAYELYRHTGAFGNAFAFLMGGVVTDYTELAALWVNIGRRTVLWLLLITLPLVLVVGWVLNSRS